MTDLSRRIVLLPGGTSAAGRTVARALVAAGATVVIVGRDAAKLDEIATELAQAREPEAGGAENELRTFACDLTDDAAVRDLTRRVHDEVGHVDGILHLVGGWRGGGGLAGQSDDDFRFLEAALTALRHVSRAFDEDLRASDAARQAIVSSTAVERPLAGGANYAAIKAASEAWLQATAQGFAKSARDAGTPLAAASVIYRVKALDGLEQTLAEAFTGAWALQAETINGTVRVLSP